MLMAMPRPSMMACDGVRGQGYAGQGYAMVWGVRVVRVMGGVVEWLKAGILASRYTGRELVAWCRGLVVSRFVVVRLVW